MMHYLADPNTIIVAVVDATCPIPNQTALEMALSVDPIGRRTVGVLAKCDLVPSGDEERVLRIFRNKQHHLKQGWFAVKNESLVERRKFEEEQVSDEPPADASSKSSAETTSELRLQARNASESAFFSRPPWNALAQRDRAGVVLLREFLQDLVIFTLQSRIDAMLGQVPIPSGSTGHHSRDGSGSSILADKHRPAAAADSPTTAQHEKKENDGEKNATDDSVDLEAGVVKKRTTVLYNSVSVCLTITLTLTLVGLGCEQLAQEVATDGDWTRLFLLVTVPLQVFVSLVRFSLPFLFPPFLPFSFLSFDSLFFISFPHLSSRY